MAPLLIAIFLSIFSLLGILLTIPILCWHFQKRNTGAIFAIAWIIAMNSIIFVNAIIWPDDSLETHYQGQVLCDIQVKIQIASQVALPASFACVLRALARVMNLNQAAIGQTKKERRKELSIDILCCIGFPCLQMVFHYFVQARRYILASVSGCVATASNSWLSVLLLYVPPVLWDMICTYLAVLISVRIYNYRRSFRTILANSDTNQSRFLRLFLLCLLWIIASLPIQIYIFYSNLAFVRGEYSWADTHNADLWDNIMLVPSNGTIVFDRWIWLAAGYIVFLFFCFGEDASSMYRSYLVALRLHLLLPKSWREKMQRRGLQLRSSLLSANSRMRILVRRSDSQTTSMWSSNTDNSFQMDHQAAYDPAPLDKAHVGDRVDSIKLQRDHRTTLGYEASRAME